ncbi:MAG: pseudouridine synthase [Flavobacterium sp.]|nr:MAG: pseudouridine synthase [Flavobacterium sp.]
MEEPVHRHFIIYKPFGYLSQFIYRLKRNKRLLGDLFPFPDGTMAIGRLDEDSEGLLLLTTDGKVSELIRSRRIEKQYFAQVDGLITTEAIAALQNGVEIGFKGTKYMTLPCEAYILRHDPGFAPRSQKIRDERHGPTSWVSITVTEGKFRQVRKMAAGVGFPVLRLIRVRVGNVHLGKMQPGEVIEVADLINYCEM